MNGDAFPMTPVVPAVGWIVGCHRTGCGAAAWLPKTWSPRNRHLATHAPLVREIPRADLPSGWVTIYWDTSHTRILEQDDPVIAARPHYFCSEGCRQAGCVPGPACAPAEVTAEIARQVAASAIREAVTAERAEVDALLAERMKECFCADQDSPCADCMETSRIRGVLKARAS